MQIIEYEDCCAFNFIGGKAAKNAEECSIEFPLINGRSTDIVLEMQRKKDGTYRVMEVLFPKDLPEEDVEDLSEVYWYVFPKSMRNRKVQPIIMYWKFDDRIIIASERGEIQETIEEYEEDRKLCCWMDRKTCKMMDEMEKTPFPKTYETTFFTYDDFFRKPDTRKIPYRDRGLEYARYIRRLRTMLEWSRQRGIEMEVKIGDADRAEEYIRKNGLDIDDPMSWAEATKVYDVMPYVVYEIEDYNIYVAGEVRAAVNMLSYFPDVSGRIDCIAAEIYTKNEVICTVKAWLNPLYEGEVAYDAAMRNISQYFEKYGVKRAVMPEFSVPYDSCPDCGQLGITRVKGEWDVS